MFYVNMISYFSSLFVVFAIIKTIDFGNGLLIWLPYSIIRFFVEAYFELDVLINVWAVVGYSVFGLITGFSAEIFFKILKNKTNLDERVIAGLTGVVMSLTYFITVILTLGFFYKVGWAAGSFRDPGSFLGVGYFYLPWILINAFFGGFSAYGIHYFSNHKSEKINKIKKNFII